MGMFDGIMQDIKNISFSVNGKPVRVSGGGGGDDGGGCGCLVVLIVVGVVLYKLLC